MPGLDATRGLLMVLMALDHSMAFICNAHFNEFWAAPMSDYGGSLLAFFTRYTSHLCAPGFAFLMGAGMILFADSRSRRGWGTVSLIRHFWARAFILVAASLTLENFFWYWGFLSSRIDAPWFVFFSILCTLAGCMMLGALLLRLRPLWLMLLSVVLVAATPFVLPLGQPREAISAILSLPRIILFVPWEFPTFLGKGVFIYPILPWLGITLAGMVLGRALLAYGDAVLKRIHLVGAALLLAFVAVRFSGVLGNIHQAEPKGVIGFLAITKYPPSPAFVLSTLGINCLLLGALSRLPRFHGEANPLQVFGRVPFFFYLLHIAVYCLISKIVGTSSGYAVGYGVWLAGLALLYIPCRRFAAFKRGTSPDSPWRLL